MDIWQRCIGYTSISIAWDTDVKSMFFTMCLRSLVVRALERYSKDPGSSPGEIHVFHVNKSCFQLEDALASGSRRSPNLG